MTVASHNRYSYRWLWVCTKSLPNSTVWHMSHSERSHGQDSRLLVTTNRSKTNSVKTFPANLLFHFWQKCNKSRDYFYFLLPLPGILEWRNFQKIFNNENRNRLFHFGDVPDCYLTPGNLLRILFFCRLHSFIEVCTRAFLVCYVEAIDIYCSWVLNP